MLFLDSYRLQTAVFAGATRRVVPAERNGFRPNEPPSSGNRRKINMRRAAGPALLFLFLGTPTVSAAGITLVDFGSSSGSNIYGLAGWNTPLKSGNLAYTSAGGGGVRAVTDPGEYGDYRGVRGTPRHFSKGERIVVTWINDSEETFFFTSRISLTDSNEPNETAPDGDWYTMRRYTDYRFTYSEIQPHGTAKTVFNIEDAGVHGTNGEHSLVNINLAVEWGSTYQKSFLICDKIELFDDADIVPPETPTGLTAAALSHSKVRLSWNIPPDNVAVVEYLITLNGEIEQYARSAADTCVLLEPDREYSLQVSALDAAGNESALSVPVRVRTPVFNARSGLVHPDGVRYLGAFALPETFAWGGEAVAYRPDGDGGQAGFPDGAPGSLFVTNLNQSENGLVGEVSLPAPVISASRDIGDLPVAGVLSEPVNIRPANVNGWDFVDVWRTGLEVVPEEGRLYSAWSYHYTVTGEKHASISCCDLSDPAGSDKRGAWFPGDPGVPPNDAGAGDWLFSLPRDWAAAHCSGRFLVSGRCRDGGLSGLGPTLYAFAGVGNAPPGAGGVLPVTALLQYGPVEASDNVHFPRSIDGYNHADEWRAAMWIAAGGQGSVAVMGNKALGDNWYGYTGERMRHDWVIADVPAPDFWATDPDGKGWRAHHRRPMIIFFDPADLAAVAAGTLATYEPQPYAALRLSEDIFFGSNHEIFSAAFDSENRILYAVEFVREAGGSLVVHAWRVDAVTSVRSRQADPSGFRLLQNHPNPFNSETTVPFRLRDAGRVTLKVVDALGNEIAVLADGRYAAGNHSVRFNASSLPSGVYIIRMKADGFTASRKVALMK
jgi:hypothetical protein